jgi:hypothetical protein
MGTNLGIQEIAALILLFMNYRIDSSMIKIFHADIVFALLLFIFSFVYLFLRNDVAGFLIASRTLLFVFAALTITGLKIEQQQYLIKTSVFITLVFISFSVSKILLNLLTRPFDILNFFYGSDEYRIRAPFELEGSASSQVPIGYMLALVLCAPLVISSRFKSFVFLLGAIGTTSRSSLLSIVFVFFRRYNFKKASSIFSIIVLSFLLFLVFLKSFTANEGQLDGSALKRIYLFFTSINSFFENPSSLLFGFGISTESLHEFTGEGFYESFVVNSFMQGGLILLFTSLWILLKSLYFDYRYRIYSFSIVVVLGNAIGGSNYFSMFAYPLMVLIISLAVKEHHISLDEKSFTPNHK